MLAVDQFEEVFTACSDVGERAAYLDAITEAARSRTAPPRSSSRCERTSTGDVLSIEHWHPCSPPTRSWLDRWTRTSCGERSSFPPNERT
jgi:hypothetical protein